MKIPPDTSLADKIRKVNLEVHEAIAELVANSFDARRKNQKSMKIEICTSGSGKDLSLQIIDNGSGMNLKELGDALSLAKSSKGEDLKGVYGLGLKTSAGIIGNRLIIETTTNESGPILRAIYDINQIESSKKWEVPYEELDRDESTHFKSRAGPGTIISISELTRPYYLEQLEPIRSFLSLAFKQHLEEGDEIFLCKNKITPYQYDLFDNTREEISAKINGQQIKGWVAIQKKGYPKANFGRGLYAFGITIYRKKQLVDTFCKEFLLKSHISYGNVVGELNADFIEVNYTKKGINITSPSWGHVVKKMKEKIKKFCRGSKKLHEKKKVVGGKEVKLTNEDAVREMYRTIGRTPPSTLTGPSMSVGKKEEGPTIEPISLAIDEIKLIGENEVMVANRKIKFEFISQEDDESPWQWHDSELNRDGKMVIILNKSFNLLKSAKKPNEKKILCVLALAEEFCKYLVNQGVQEAQSRKDVFEWINENYDKISVELG